MFYFKIKKILLFFAYTGSLTILLAAPHIQLKPQQPLEATRRYMRRQVIQNTSVLWNQFKSCSSFTGWIAMNQNLYGQSETSSSSCGFLTNNKQCCVTSSIRRTRNLQRARTGPASCPAPVPGGSSVPAAGGKRGALPPPGEDTRVPPLRDPRWPVALTL